MSVITKLPTTDNNEHKQSSTVNQAHVRITNIDDRGFVEFQFSIGDPNLYLEMALPRAAFDEFCITQQARHLTTEEEKDVDQTELKWRFGDLAQEADSEKHEAAESEE